MAQKQESRQGSLYRKGKKRLLRKSIKKIEEDRYAKGRCGKGMVVDPESGKCMKRPNIKKVLGVGPKRNLAAREPLTDLPDRKVRAKENKSFNVAQRKKAKAKAKKRYQ